MEREFKRPDQCGNNDLEDFRRSWTGTELKKCKKLRKEFSILEIACLLNRSQNSIRCALWRSERNQNELRQQML